MINKINSITLVRVISMIFIILCHTIGYYHFIPGANALGGLFNVGIYSFFIISGYLYGEKEIKQFGRWYLQRFVKIWLPASVFVGMVLLIFFVCKQKFNGLSILIYLLNLSGFGACVQSFYLLFEEIEAFSHLWFIFNIMLCYLFLPLFHNLKKMIHKNNTTIQFVVGLLFVNYMLSTLIDLRFIYLITFFIGYCLKGRFEETIKSNQGYFFATCLMIVMQLLRVVINMINFNPIGYAAFSEISHLFLGLWIFISVFYFENKLPKVYEFLCSLYIVKWLDKSSFYIYIVHHVFSVGGSIFCCYRLDNLFFATLLFIICTLVFTILLDLIMKQIYKFVVI